MAFERELAAVRAAVEQAKPLGEAFQTGTAKFYEDQNPVPVLICSIRVKKPRPSAFDAGNQTVWATKRITVAKVPLELPAPYQDFVITQGLIVQIETPDGDPTINKVNFRVDSALTSQFAAERQVVLTTEVVETARIS